MISGLKLFLLRLFWSLNRIRCRLKGMRVGKGCVIDRMPYVRRASGSRIELGDDVTLLSSSRHNPLIQRRMNIQTGAPGAVLEIHSHAGISGSRIVCFNHISIGEYTIIGPETLVFDWKAHDYSPETGWRGRKELRGKPIHIGKRCYIGTGCIILKGVTIGDDCVVSAGCVVNQDVPPCHMAYGNPMQLSPLPEHLHPSGN